MGETIDGSIESATFVIVSFVSKTDYTKTFIYKERYKAESSNLVTAKSRSDAAAAATTAMKDLTVFSHDDPGNLRNRLN